MKKCSLLYLFLFCSLHFVSMARAETNEPPACTFTISPLARNHSAGVSTGTVSVATGSNCIWGANTTNAWITVLSPTTNEGSGLVVYRVVANNGPGRTGFIRIGEATFTVGQAGQTNGTTNTCLAALSPTSRSHGPGASTGTVEVAIGSNCVWSATPSNGWINILSSPTNEGPGTVVYGVDANSGPTRFGSIRIGGRTFFVTQTGVTNSTNTTCTYALSPSNGVHTATGGTGFVSVATQAGCPWNTFTSNFWIHIGSSLSNAGSGAVAYFVEANESSLPRTGVIRIDGRNFFVNQDAAPSTNQCLISISPTGRVHGAGSETAVVSVTVQPGCTWSYANTNPWISTLPIIGPSNGAVQYTVTANNSTFTRVGIISISGLSYVVTQLGANGPGTNTTCTYALSPSNGVYGAQGGTGFVSVATQAGCPWNVFTSNFWIHIGSSLSNAGSGTVLYSVDVNESSPPRTGVIRIDGRNFFVNQAGAPSTNGCLISISPTGRVHGAGSETAVISVTVPPGCTWSYINTNPWISTLPMVGPGNGALQYTVTANNSTSTRVGIISISGRPYLVTQLGASDPGTNTTCTFDVSPLARPHDAGVSTGTVSVATGPNCLWPATSTNAWITVLSPATNFGNGTVVYRVDANAGPGRTGYIRIDGRIFTVAQAGLTNGPGTNTTCTFEVSPWARSHPSWVSTGTVSVGTGPNCLWLSTTTNGWITVLSSVTNFGSGTVVYRVTANAGPGRTGYIRIDGRTFSVFQAGLTNGPGTNTICTFELSPRGRNHDTGESTGAVFVATGPNCLWLATSTNAWITVLSSTTNFGGGTVVYRVDANPGPSRNGGIRIDGKMFFVGQAGLPNGPGTNAPAVLQVCPPSPGVGPMLFLNGPPEQRVVVECSEDLIRWTPISTNVAPCAVIDWPGLNSPRRFYRPVFVP